MIDVLDDLLGTAPEETPPGDGCLACQAPPHRDCTSCGRPACRDHLWTMLGVCTQCADAERLERFQRRAEPEGRNWLEAP